MIYIVINGVPAVMKHIYKYQIYAKTSACIANRRVYRVDVTVLMT